MLKHGYSTLLADSRAHGASGAEYMSFGVREAHDVRLWAEWLQRQGARRLYGLGESMGGAILLQSLARSAPFDAVIAESPFSSFPEIARYRVAQVAGFQDSPLRPIFRLIVDPALLLARIRHGAELYLASPAEAVRHARVPVLLIHGTADTNIPHSHSEAIRAANPRAELWSIPGGQHTNAIAARPEEFERRVLGWFQ